MDKQVYIFETPHQLTNFYMKLWAEMAVEAICEREIFTTALSGGHTPVEFFCKLSALENFNVWRNTVVFQTDERFVSTEENDNNFRMIRESLLNYINIPDGNIFPIHTDVDNALVAADKYEQAMRQYFNLDEGFPVFDLINLGIGLDGHSASLFPESDALKENHRWVLPVTAGGIEHARISLTYPVINGARNIIFHVQGKEKAEIVKRVINEDYSLPAARINPHNGRVIFLLDQEAASAISYGDNYENLEEGILLCSDALAT